MSHWDSKVGKGVKPSKRLSQPLHIRAPRRFEMLTFIREHIAAGNDFPTRKELADKMGWSREGSVNNTLENLCHIDGMIERDPSVRAGWRLKEAVSA